MEKSNTIQTQDGQAAVTAYLDGLKRVGDKYNPIINFLHRLFEDYSLPGDLRSMAIEARDKVEAIRDFEALKYKGVA